MDIAPGRRDERVGEHGPSVRVRPGRGAVGSEGPRWYTPREYASTDCRHPGEGLARSRRGPAADRGDDLRELRQPHRAVPRPHPGRRGPRPSTWPPRSATIRYLPDVAGRAELVAAIEAAGYDVRPGAPPADAPATDPLADVADPDAARPGARGCRAAPSGGRLDRRRPRDHGGHVLAADPRSRPTTSTGWRSCRRRSSRVGRRPVLPGGVAGGPPRGDEHGHARGRRHDRRVGLQRRRDALAAGRPRRRARHRDLLRHARRSSSAWSCSGAGSRPGRRAGRPARSAGSSALQATSARLVLPGGDEEVRSSGSSPATSCASGRATACRSTGGSSRAARRSMSRC